jgi:hypothetical protein
MTTKKHKERKKGDFLTKDGHRFGRVLTRRASEKEHKEWSQFSATQLARQYSPEAPSTMTSEPA